jgi:hypothetical protein
VSISIISIVWWWQMVVTGVSVDDDAAVQQMANELKLKVIYQIPVFIS